MTATVVCLIAPATIESPTAAEVLADLKREQMAETAFVRIDDNQGDTPKHPTEPTRDTLA